MPLVHLSDMINHAYRHNYAVGAFGVANLHFLEGIMQAAENCRAPVVLNLIESHFESYDFELLMPAVTAAARRAAVPVAINFDHGSSRMSAERAIRAGCNGVMVDTSALTFSENMWQTRDIVTMAHACGITVEGELGYVPGVEGENAKNHPGELAYTSAAEAAGYVERTGVDCLAVSVGTVHGRMKGTPKLDYSRLAKIREATAIPLVIHGGTGLSDEQFRRLIANGVAKINYYTALADVADRSIREYVAANRKGGHSSLLTGVRDAVREETERCLGLWGCGGRAAEVLAQCRPWQEVEQITLYNVPSTLSEIELAAIMREGRQLIAAIPGVRSIRTSQTIQPDGKYHHGLSVTLASQSALASYRNHPAQLRFSHKVLRPVLTDPITLDMEER
ncbi:MAG: class II fructose-bisphosphate aldolase [Gallionella sp.]|nr:class II fructose-bisphosphate aldolase [Gallionella sp.]